MYSVSGNATLSELVNEYVLRYKDVDSPEELALVLCGNKTDLVDARVVTIGQGLALAEKWHVPFFEVSAVAKINVDEVFFECVKKILRIRQYRAEARTSEAEKKSISKDRCVIA